eukprot:2921905-Prymnesium_polylepis.1
MVQHTAPPPASPGQFAGEVPASNRTPPRRPSTSRGLVHAAVHAHKVDILRRARTLFLSPE